MNDGKMLASQDNIQQMLHVFLDCMRIRFPVLSLKSFQAKLLFGRFISLTSEFAIGEVEKKVSIFLNSHIVVKWIILTQLEGFKPIDYNFGGRPRVCHRPGVKKQAMAAHAANMAVDGAWTDLQLPGNLSVSHAADGFHEDLTIEIGTFLPIGCAEGLCAEGDIAGLACKPLDTPAVNQPGEVPSLFESEAFS